MVRLMQQELHIITIWSVMLMQMVTGERKQEELLWLENWEERLWLIRVPVHGIP